MGLSLKYLSAMSSSEPKLMLKPQFFYLSHAQNIVIFFPSSFYTFLQLIFAASFLPKPKRCRLVRTMASTPSAGGTKVQKSEEEWRTVLNPEQFRILREKGTEWAGTGQYNKHYDEGVYECAACGTPLYKSTTKFDSGCGWPAFFEGLPGAITETPDADGRRTEITCTACGGHLGHVFKGEGFKTPTDARHCVNSISLNFTPANK
ncbi:unnamed protein product [Sphagnum jensenii]|uniref:Peptide-methionine (R)-S-oxide reductase n=1 Tax=Sphagnum jensenii TaxID=128206 RepID=A0ABP0W2S2_9BRYO